MRQTRLSLRLLYTTLLALAVVFAGVASAGAAPSSPAASAATPAFWLAYYAGQSGRYDIFLVSADGRSKRQLTGPNRFDEAEPAWRPDGQAVAYESNELGDYDIWVAVAGEGPFVMVGSSEDELEPDWEPGGNAIVFVQGPFVDNQGILTIANEAGEVFALGTGGVRGRSPAWSPSGNQIAFMAKQDGHWQIFIYDFRSDDVEQLSYCTQLCRYPSWSPDGQTILFHAANDRLQPLSIWRMPAQPAGSFEDVRQLVLKGQAPGRPNQATDGRLAFNGPNDLYLLPAASGDRRLIANTRGGIAPDWSPLLAAPPQLGKAIDLTPTPTPPPVQSPRFRPGDHARVDPVSAWDGLNVRALPGADQRILFELEPNERVTILDGPVTIPPSPWYQVRAEDGVGWVNGRYLLPAGGQPAARYFNLIWVPGCAPQRPLVALALPGQNGCTPGVETWDLDFFADEIRAQGLIGRHEWLVAVSLGGKANQGLVIRDAGNARKGWIRIGGGAPGSVWRTRYSETTQVGPRCRLRTNYTWECA